MNDQNYVVEWSQSQGCYHVQSVEEMLEQNLSACMSGRQTDYVPVAVCRSHWDAHELIKAIEIRKEKA